MQVIKMFSRDNQETPFGVIGIDNGKLIFSGLDEETFTDWASSGVEDDNEQPILLSEPVKFLTAFRLVLLRSMLDQIVISEPEEVESIPEVAKLPESMQTGSFIEDDEGDLS